MHRLLAATLLSLAAFSASAQDTPADRAAAADYYLSVVPVSKLIDDMVAETSKQLPPDQQLDFRRKMKTAVDTQTLAVTIRAAMIKHFTADELNALGDFYGSKAGASAMSKFGAYAAEIMPTIHEEVQRGIRKVRGSR